ncbi:MAG: winged helix-turn-helix domain-containing protein [Nostoc sp.]|uniref:winged helix-turn-helix domain-containing protein n=1 Tax=Nostoc sp. TaxID=1180 RepID=UPI002FF723D9
MKVEQVAAITGFSADWVGKIARCYNALGVEGIVEGHKNNPGGKQKALTPEQQKKLFQRLQSPPDDGGLWSGPKVGELIKQQFGIGIHRTTAWRQLRRLGLTLQLPRPLDEKSATLEQRGFLKAQLKFFVRLMRVVLQKLGLVW